MGVLKMSKFIVLDIVFYGGSLNYDQGTGNFQELKKITKWDGRQYTMVSRYALRYSLLETGKTLGFWDLAPSAELQRAGESEKTVIQPGIEILLSGKILQYPEFNLFGYLITNTKPQNSREAPVKISHAVSLTPFTFDNHFCANLSLAKRMIDKTGKMDPNPFNIEEHQTYYIYTVVIDVDKIEKGEVYLLEKNKEEWESKIEVQTDKYKISIKAKKPKKGVDISGDYEILKMDKIKINNKEFVIKVEDESIKDTVNKLKFSIENQDFTKNIISDLITTILNLNRTIKARNEFLHPKLLVVGIYENKSYESFKDRIVLADEYEEVCEEIPEPIPNGTRILRRIVKCRRPIFEIKGKEIEKSDLKDVDETKVIEFINKLFVNNVNNTSKSSVSVFKSPEIEVKCKEESKTADNKLKEEKKE